METDRAKIYLHYQVLTIMISSPSNSWCVKLVGRLKGGINVSLCVDENSLLFRKRHFVVKITLLLLKLPYYLVSITVNNYLFWIHKTVINVIISPYRTLNNFILWHLYPDYIDWGLILDVIQILISKHILESHFQSYLYP